MWNDAAAVCGIFAGLCFAAMVFNAWRENRTNRQRDWRNHK